MFHQRTLYFVVYKEFLRLYFEVLMFQFHNEMRFVGRKSLSITLQKSNLHISGFIVSSLSTRSPYDLHVLQQTLRCIGIKIEICSKIKT